MEEKNRNLLSYAGILNILEGALLCVFKPAAIYGLIIMAIGVYITYRILDIADLTVEGSFATGGAVAVMLILSKQFSNFKKNYQSLTSILQVITSKVELLSVL